MKKNKYLLGVLLLIVALTGCNKKEENPQSVDNELVNKLDSICNATYDFTSDDEIERQLANSIVRITVGADNSISVILKPFKKINKLVVNKDPLIELKQAYDMSDSEIESTLRDVYANTRTSNCFILDDNTKEIIVSDFSMVIPTLLQESNILNNLMVYENYIQYEVRLILSE